MDRFYSASTGGFYESGLHKQMPADAKQISEELYRQVMLERPAGKIVISGEDGLPTLADPPAPTDEQLAALVRLQRDALLREVYDPAVAMLQRFSRIDPDKSEQYAAKLAEFDAWAVALQAIPEQEGFPQNVAWPEQPNKEL